MKKIVLILVMLHLIGFGIWFLIFNEKSKVIQDVNPVSGIDKNKKNELPPQVINEIVVPSKGDPKKDSDVKDLDKSLLTHEVELVMQQPEKVTIYSLEPKFIERLLTGEELFGSYKVIGKAELSIEEMAIAIKEVESFVFNSDQSIKSVCFSPVIGIQIKSGNKHVDFMISFECTRMQFFSNTKVKFKEIFINGTPDELNKILIAHKIPLKRID